MFRSLMLVDTGYTVHLLEFEDDLCVKGPWANYYLLDHTIQEIRDHYRKDKYNRVYILDAEYKPMDLSEIAEKA